MEEPENGIHPANLAAMLELVKDLAVDAHGEPDASNPFWQVIVYTHSPGLVQLCEEGELVFARIPHSGSGLQLYGYENSWRVTILTASATTGGRRGRVARRFGEHRSRLLEHLDLDGPVTGRRAWQELLDDVHALADELRT